MARRKDSLLEDLMVIASKLPWPAELALALGRTSSSITTPRGLPSFPLADLYQLLTNAGVQELDIA